MFLSFSTSFMIRSHLTLFLLTQQNSCHGHERYIVVHFLPVNIYLSVKFRRRWKGSETFLTVSTANFHIAICRSPCPHKSNRNCSVSSARRPADGVFWFRDDEPKRNIYIYRHDTTTIIFTDSSPNFYLWYGASRPRRNGKKKKRTAGGTLPAPSGVSNAITKGRDERFLRYRTRNRPKKEERKKIQTNNKINGFLSIF